LAGMRAWRSARGNAQFLRHGGRNLSGATHGSLRGSSIATILSRDEPIEKAEVKGWIRSVRKQKKIAFAALGDGSTLDSLQAVLKPEQVEQ
jgi:asparaginyl-tRNA synthetase